MRSDDCTALVAGDPSAAAGAHLELMLTASPGLGELRFRHGPFVGRSVAEVASSAGDVAAIADVLALSYAGCVDHGLLGETTITPQCEGEGEPVTGVEGAPCSALDHGCGRGFLSEDDTGACCRSTVAALGAACVTTDGPGACDETGTCDSSAIVPTGRVSTWAEVLSGRGTQPRVEAWTSGSRTVIRVEEVWDEAALEEVPESYDTLGWAAVPSDVANATRVGLARTRAEVDGADGLLLAHARPGRTSIFLHDTLASGGSVADVEEVVALTVPVDSLLYLGADGSTVPRDAGIRVACADATSPEADAAVPAPSPAAVDATSLEPHCRRFDGYLEVSAINLTAALVPTRVSRDVRPGGTLTAPIASPTALALGGMPPGPALCTPGDTRDCGCGTQFQRCIAGRWGRCRPGFELCNGCDDDRDGNVDENGSALCDDGIPCTLDACAGRTPRCVAIPAPPACRRGACTRGVCNGMAGAGPGPFDPRTRPAEDANGCTWDESDARCEAFDGCSCNGMAICQGAQGPQWTGILPINRNEGLATSRASCRPRGALEPRYPLNDSRFTARLCSSTGACPLGEQCVAGGCFPVRNGGCDTDGNVCTVDDMCLEPNPATSTCGVFAGPQGPSLRALQTSLQGFVNPYVASTDGITVSCAGNVVGIDLPPSPFNFACQLDGLPCTAPSGVTGPATPAAIACSVTPAAGLGAAPTMNCAPEENRLAGSTVAGSVADLISTSFNVSTLSFQPVTANQCLGEALAPIGGRSCYEEMCDGMGLCYSRTNSNRCGTGVFAHEECGGPFECVGNAGPAPGGPTGPVISSSAWGPTVIAASDGAPMVGCQRSTGCWAPLLGAPDDCYDANEPNVNLCLQCIPGVSPEGALSPRREGVCGPRGDDGSACAQCDPTAACQPLDPLPTSCNT